MRKTAFYDYHIKKGAKMVPFAGFEMPVEYTGVKQEHVNVRENVGIFDVSHMGEIWIKGPGAFDLVQKITSNDIQKLSEGAIQYAYLPNETGGIVDDLLVYYFNQEKFLLVVNASNIEKDYQWIVDHNDEGAEIENASDWISQLAIQGPRAMELLQKLTPIDLSAMPYYHFEIGSFSGGKEVIISNTGYTGSGGFELYLYNEDAPTIWELIFEAGKDMGVEPAGLAARDTLRLEMGFCLYGNDIDENTSPLEAGLGWITKFNEGNDFINRKALEEEKAAGVKRKLIGFEMKERGIPRKDYPLLDAAGQQIGVVTSGTMSPMLGKGIGLGYVSKDYLANGDELFIGIRNKKLAVQKIRLPFYSPKHH